MTKENEDLRTPGADSPAAPSPPQSSTAIDLLSPAMVQAQGEFPMVPFDRENPYYHSPYASFAATVRAVKPVLTKYGLWFYQQPYLEGYRWCVRTILVHASGQWISNTVSAVPTVGSKRGPDGDGEPTVEEDARRLNPQRVSSANTYERRIGLTALLGIAADDDDDGEACQEDRDRVRIIEEIRRVAPQRLGKEGSRAWMAQRIGDRHLEKVETAMLNIILDALVNLKATAPAGKGGESK